MTEQHDEKNHNQDQAAGEAAARPRREEGAGGPGHDEPANDPGPAAAADDGGGGGAEAAFAEADERDMFGGAADEREAALEAEVAELKDRLLRTLAEMENMRRRTQRDIDDARRYAVTGFARDLLEVADSLGRALQTIPERAREEVEFIRNLADGVAMTERALLNAFERHRIAKVEPRPGDRFDHNLHQAMFEVATDDQPPGTVAQVLQAGYTIGGDRLLRPAMVGVAKAGAGAAAGDGGGGWGEASDRRQEQQRPGDRVDTTA